MGCANSKSQRRKKARGLRVDEDDDDIAAETAYKVVIIGSRAVGKSCLVLRVTKDAFSDSHNVTIGAAFSAKTIHTQHHGDVKLHIWDTAGEEMYRAMTRSFYRGAQACILCFDITNRQSFDSLPQWVKEFREECPDAVITLCGNKADLADKRRVDNTEAMEFVQRHGLSAYLEVSAKSNTNVLELFQHTADSAIVKGQRVDRRAM